jgi:transposase
VIHVTEGKGKATLQAIRQHLANQGVDPQPIQQASLDLSPAFIAGVRESFPAAQITFDRLPVVKLLNEAMDKVRQAERKAHEALKGHQYTFLKNPQNLSETKPRELAEMIPRYPTWGAA